MTKLPEKWISGYDGQRWFYQYEPTGMIQYHFPQEGDEYAEFLLDVGTGPIKLTPEDSLAIEQENKRRSISSIDDDSRSGPKTSGSKREKKKIAAIEEEYSMSANGYFDSSAYYPDTISPLGDDDPEETPRSSNNDGIAGNGDRRMSVAAELPGSSQQVWSPVGFVAELATQDTVKCAEELAPIELDATSYTPAPIQTNIAQGPAELPTHRTPVEDKTLVENKTLVPKPTQAAMQAVDSYPLTSASFAYPPLKPDVNSVNGVSPGAISIGRKPVPSNTNTVDVGQNKFQPWKPTQGSIEQPPQAQNNAPAAFPQTSVLQNQDSELGGFGRKNSKNSDSSILGGIPNTLAPPLEPRKPMPIETSPVVDGASSIPAVLHPAHRPGEELSSIGTSNQQAISGNQTKHDGISIPVAGHDLSYTPSVLKPGSNQPDNSLQESEGKHAQESILPHRPPEQRIQASSAPADQSSVTAVNVLPTANSKMNGSPGFLFFHEIPSKTNPVNHATTAYPEDSPKPNVAPQASNSQTSDSNGINSQSGLSADEQIPVVAPLNFVKRHSYKASQVSSITSEAPLGKPTLTSSDDISEVISVISSFTPQGTPAPSSQPFQRPAHIPLGDNSKPSPTSMSEGMGAPIDGAVGSKPQPINQQLPSPAITMQHSHTISPLQGQVTSAPVNISKPASVAANPMAQANTITPPSNTGITPMQSRPNTQATHHSSPSIQGLPTQNQHPSQPLTSQAGNPGNILMSPAPLKPQGSTSTPFLPQTSAATAPGRPPSQANSITHANPAKPGIHNNPIHHANNAVQQTQPSVPTPHVNGPTQIPVGTPVQQGHHHPPGQSNAPPPSTVGPPIFGHPQSAAQKPQLQHPVPVGPSSVVQPPVGHQVAQISSQPPYQHSSPVAQTVSPLQSQVSSPAQSIASLHLSQSSTPSSTFATMNTHASPHSGPNVNVNQTNIAPTRPSSVPAHALSQQTTPPVGFHPKPSAPAGNIQAQSSPTPNPPAKPYPMLPGQVTPLPSQVGSTPVPSPPQQFNNHAKPTANTQQIAVGQQPMQTTPGGPIQHQGVPGQVNTILNPPGGNLMYGLASSQAQMKPPQHQPPPPHAGGYQPSVNQSTPQHPQHPQHAASYPSPTVTTQPHNSHSAVPHSALPTVGQHSFPPPPVAQAQQFLQSPGVASPVSATQGKPFTSAQATAALTDAGKGMKKWAKKVWKNPAIKQTAVGFGGAAIAGSMGVNGAAGAQIANSLFASATRPPLNHAQTAPPQAHGPGAVSQAHPMQMGQQHQLVKPQPLHLQPNHHMGQPQPGHPSLGHPPAGHPQPGHPQPGHPQPGHPQPGHPQPGHSQPGHPQPGHPQPGHPQPGHPQSGQFQAGQVQLGYAQSGHPQLGHPQPIQQQPVGAQMPGRPPVAQNPTLAAGVAVNINAQAQAQVGFNQQQQYGLVRPVMVNIPPPPPFPPPPTIINIGAPSAQAPQPQVQAQVQANVDAANLATAAMMVGSAVGAAFRQNNSQPQHGHAQSGQTSHPESHGGGDHGYATEHHGGAHEQTHGSSVPPPAPATYTDNGYMASDTTYVDNSSYSVNNTYIDNTEVVNNTIYIDNSTAVGADTTYDNTGYADTATFSSTEVTANMAVDIDINSTVYTDNSVTGFSTEETINITASSDLAVDSTDYSGSGWGDFDF